MPPHGADCKAWPAKAMRADAIVAMFRTRGRLNPKRCVDARSVRSRRAGARRSTASCATPHAKTPPLRVRVESRARRHYPRAGPASPSASANPTRAHRSSRARTWRFPSTRARRRDPRDPRPAAWAPVDHSAYGAEGTVVLCGPRPHAMARGTPHAIPPRLAWRGVERAGRSAVAQAPGIVTVGARGVRNRAVLRLRQDWPEESFRALFARFPHGVRFLLFGTRREPLAGPNVSTCADGRRSSSCSPSCATVARLVAPGQRRAAHHGLLHPTTRSPQLPTGVSLWSNARGRQGKATAAGCARPTAPAARRAVSKAREDVRTIDVDRGGRRPRARSPQRAPGNPHA